MPSPGVVTNDLRVIRGQSKTWLLEVKSAEDGTYVSLESGEVRMTVKKAVEDERAAIAKVSTDTSQIEIQTPQTDPNKKGRAKVFLKPEDTLQLQPGDYVYDVWVKNATGDWEPVVKKAKFVIDWSITLITV